MARQADQRIELVFGGPVAPADAIVLAGNGPAPQAIAIERFSSTAPLGHGVACACCAPRSQASLALTRLFLARARGEVAWFKRVVVLADPATQAALRAVLADDVLTRARFVLAEHGAKSP